MVTRLTPLGQRRTRTTTIPATIPNVAPIETTPIQTSAVKQTDMFKLASLLKTPQTPGRTPSFAGNTIRPAGTARVSGVAKQPRQFDADKFASIAGLLAQAIAPGTVQGRVGGAISAIGSEAVRKKEALAKEERVFERGALGRDLTRAQIEKAKRLPKPSESEAFIGARMKEINPATGKPFTRVESTREFKQLGRAPVKPSHHFVQDDQGNVSVFENGKLIKGSGVGKTVKKPSGIRLVTNDQGDVSVFEGGILIKGTGKGKTKTRAAGKTPVDIIKKDRIAKRKDVTAQMKEWTKSDEGFGSTPSEKSQQKKRFGAQYDADIKGWQIKYDTDGSLLYIDELNVRDDTGKKVGEIAPPKLIKSHQ
jgi:hypothetical protein